MRRVDERVPKRRPGTGTAGSTVRSALLAVVWLLSAPAPVWAAPVDDGVAAYERGDYGEALRLLGPEARDDDPKAQFYIGVMYLDGKAVAPDLRAAVDWFEKAAEQGYAPAQYNLGVSYYEDRGALQSFAEAAEWFRHAAAQGYGPAAYNLAAMYEEGLGLDRDPSKALHWYDRAAKAGLAEAMHELAAISFSGRLGPADPVRAYMWLLLAVRHGDEDAVPDRLDVEGALSPEQVRKAEELAASWKNPS